MTNGRHVRTDRIIDELLVMGAQDGEVQALHELLTRWQARFRRRALRLIDDHHGASDVAQEAMLAMVRSIGRLDDPACFGRWSYRIVANKAADWIRRRQCDRRLETRSVGEACGETSPSQQATSDDPLRRALAQLPADRCDLLLMHYVDGLSVADIAAVLDIPDGTVKSRLFHARQELVQVIEHTGSETVEKG